MKKKILAFTAIRSEYDLLSSLYFLFEEDSEIDFRLIVSGAHLSKKRGLTVNDILKDGFNILEKIKTLDEDHNDNDDKASRLKSSGNLLTKAIKAVIDFNPDLIIFAGDREEVIIASIIAGYLEIPSVHFYGGDYVADSHIDNPVRNACSKLSTIHMVSIEEHKNRLISMGEESERIHVVGSIALDKFRNPVKFSKKQIFNKLNLSTKNEKIALLIFHPIPKERKFSALIFKNILNALSDKEVFGFVSFPNIDPGNIDIINAIKEFENDSNFFFYKNLSRELFLSIYKSVDFIIGNSSSGILESASIPIPCINVGYRQKNRKSNANVIYSKTDVKSISESIKYSISKENLIKISKINNIYGNGFSSKKAYELIKNNDFKNLIYKDIDPLKI
ncbi:UDP-N-acetylglucosamine 2-epimerase [Flavobacteriaceae bacterium]|nr:UDP-N-acetylglucosamine 2-epimerase [Flavobacteriaceae bacterium]